MSIYDTVIVEEDELGLYAEINGERYEGALPPLGSEVTVRDTYTTISGDYHADIMWSGDTPSGERWETLKRRV